MRQSWRGRTTLCFNILLAGLLFFAFAPHHTNAQATHEATPRRLLASTYLGGAGDDTAQAVGYDQQGNIFVAGWTYSSQVPGTTGERHDRDVFVTKLNPSATTVLYSVRLGGSSDDAAYGLAVDGQGNVWVTGETRSANFPAKNAFWPYRGDNDTFVVKLDSNGALLASSFLGDPGTDKGNAIAVDSKGNAYIVGELSATFGSSVLVAKVAASGKELLSRATFGQAKRGFLKGSQGLAAAVDDTGRLYVAGTTNTIAFEADGLIKQCVWIEDGDCLRSDAFVVVLNPEGNHIIASTLLGGHENDEASGIAVDGAHNVYVTGSTFSSDFPLQHAWQREKRGLDTFSDGFVAKLNPTLDALAYATYYGGDLWDEPQGIAVTSAGEATLVGLSSSQNLPVPHAIQDTLIGVCIRGNSERPCYDAFVAAFDAKGSLSMGTYLGGAFDDQANAIAASPDGTLYLAGRAESFGFPTTGGVVQMAKAGNADAFLAKLGAAGVVPGRNVSVYLPLVKR